MHIMFGDLLRNAQFRPRYKNPLGGGGGGGGGGSRFSIYFVQDCRPSAVRGTVCFPG